MGDAMNGANEKEVGIPLGLLTGENIHKVLVESGIIGCGPENIAPGIHGHNADEISGLDRPHSHPAGEVVGLEDVIKKVIDSDYTTGVIRSRVDSMTASGAGKLVRESHTHDMRHSHDAGSGNEINVNGLRGVLAEPQVPQKHGHSPNDFSVDRFRGRLSDPQAPDKHGNQHGANGNDEVNVGGLKGELAELQKPRPHSHTKGDFTVDGFAGKLAQPQTPERHAPSHGVGQGDQIDLSGLAGETATPQPPKRHGHSKGDFSVDGFKGKLAQPQTPDIHHRSHGAEGPDPIDVTGLRGVLGMAQMPCPHAPSHGASGGDPMNVGNLPGVLKEPQTPRRHGDRHGKDGDDSVNLADLPGTPKALSEHTAKDSSVHGIAGKAEAQCNRGKPKGYASLDEKGGVEQMPAAASDTVGPGRIPIADSSGKLDAWVSMTPDAVRKIAAGQVSEILQPTISEAVASLDEKIAEVEGKAPFVPPWIGRLYAAYGDCDPVKLMTSCTFRQVAPGPSPLKLGTTIRAVLFRPPSPMKLSKVLMIGTGDSQGKYQIGIYKDVTGSSPVVTSYINTSKGVFATIVPCVKLEPDTDYWFALGASSDDKAEHLQSLVAPAFPILPIRGCGMPVFAEWESADGTWGALPTPGIAMKSLGQTHGIVPLAFLKGGA